MSFTKRDFKMVLLGFFTFLILEGIYDWKNSVKAFEQGYHSFK